MKYTLKVGQALVIQSCYKLKLLAITEDFCAKVELYTKGKTTEFFVDNKTTDKYHFFITQQLNREGFPELRLDILLVRMTPDSIVLDVPKLWKLSHPLDLTVEVAFRSKA